MLKKISLALVFGVFVFLPFSCEELEGLGLSEADCVAGLKQALSFGSDSAGTQLSRANGYFGDAAVKILLPPEAQQLITYASQIGLQPYINDVVLKMNRGAEKAATKAAPIFLNAITGMTVNDGFAILKGSDTAATGYLRTATTNQLTAAFAPEINSAMDEVGATQAWNSLFSTYNNYVNTFAGQLLGLQTVETDLGAYATRRALNGLFLKVADQEKLIRVDVNRRTTDLLKRVFAEQDN